MNTNTADSTKRPNQVKCCAKRRRKTNNFHHNISASSISHSLHTLNHPLPVLHKVERLGSNLGSLIEPRLHAVHSKEMLWLERRSSHDSAESHGTTAHYHDGCVLRGISNSEEFVTSVLYQRWSHRQDEADEPASHAVEKSQSVQESDLFAHSARDLVGNANMLPEALRRMMNPHEDKAFRRNLRKVEFVTSNRRLYLFQNCSRHASVVLELMEAIKELARQVGMEVHWRIWT
ncbi:hypothetical protein HG530_012406 [Fusarium avenaceum]|nr:hypothetical protein HG530_012406 [Fusarium avenaceum]